jgi:hypothetical protein
MSETTIKLIACDPVSATFETEAGIIELGAPEDKGPMVVRDPSALVTKSDLAAMLAIAGTKCMLAAVNQGQEPTGCAIRSAAFADLTSFRDEQDLLVRLGEKWFRAAFSRRGNFNDAVWEEYWRAVHHEDRRDAMPL